MVSRRVNSIQGELSSYAIDKNGGPHSMIKDAIWDILINVRTVTHPMGGAGILTLTILSFQHWSPLGKRKNGNMLREMALAARIELHNTGVCAQYSAFAE